MAEADARDRLDAVLGGIGRLAVAVSGGVDSMTLAQLAHLRLGGDARMVHAVSAAVPPEATARVEAHARRHGWRLSVIDAGEQNDPRYLANPVNRCYFCKTNLYAGVAALIEAEVGPGTAIVSGTNTDDLGDYRPGLEAAREHAVRHPYVEAGIDKVAVRALARGLGLEEVAAMPAAPCLASRLETGLRVTPERLGLVHRIERLVSERLDPETVRCRVRADALVVELDPAALARMDDTLLATVRAAAGRADSGLPVRVEAYRRGSAFLR